MERLRCLLGFHNLDWETKIYKKDGFIVTRAVCRKCRWKRYYINNN